jgi:hypothetical protein
MRGGDIDIPANVRPVCANLDGMTPSAPPREYSPECDLVAWARQLAELHLDVPGLRERRWRHVQGVAARAEQLAEALGLGEVLVAAAWLHDIGYAPALVRTGFHSLDGATFLDEVRAPARLIGLVAQHTGAVHEAAVRGMSDLLDDYPDEIGPVRDALWTCDLTTSPTGASVSVTARLREIRERFGPDHPATLAITAAGPDALAAVERTRQRLRDAGADLDIDVGQE